MIAVEREAWKSRALAAERTLEEYRKSLTLTEEACRAAEAQIAGWKRRHDSARTREDENYAAFERDSAALTAAEARIKALEEALREIDAERLNIKLCVQDSTPEWLPKISAALDKARALLSQQEGAKP